MMFVAASLLLSSALASADGCRPLLDETHFNAEYLTSLCPAGGKTVGKTVNARICRGSKDPITKKPYDRDPAIKLARETSLKLAIVNQFYGRTLDNPDCRSYCMYDPVNVGKPVSEKRIGFIWRNGRRNCWDLVDNWTCYTAGSFEWGVAIRKAQADVNCAKIDAMPINALPPPVPSDEEPTDEMSPPQKENRAAIDAMKFLLSEVTGIKNIPLPKTAEGLKTLYKAIDDTQEVLNQLKARVVRQGLE